MKKRLSIFVLMLLFCLTALPVGALWKPKTKIQANSAYLVNLETGTVVWERDSDKSVRPASMTKMMTVLLTLEAGANLDDIVEVPKGLQTELAQIANEHGVRMNCSVGDRYTVRTLLYMTLLPSCNDSASLLAWYTTGNLDTFIQKMNDRAKELGCTATSFTCVHGLFEENTPGNWSTARDLSLIAAECRKWDVFLKIADTPRFWMPMFVSLPFLTPDASKDKAPIGYKQFYNTNPLIDPKNSLYRSYVQGMKTGYTDLAGKCFTTSFVSNGLSYILVLCGVPNETTARGNQLIYEEAVSLGDWVTTDFYMREVLTEGEVLQTAAVSASPDGTEVNLCAAETMEIFSNNSDSITYEYDVPDSLTAPVDKGQAVGTVEIFRNGESMGKVELLTEQTMEYSRLTEIQQNIASLLDDLFQ